MGEIKQNRRPAPNWKLLIAVVAAMFILMGLFFVWQYDKNRPNYRDLKKAYDELKLPADWKMVSETSNKGALGLFCWQIEGEECPLIINYYQRDKLASSEPPIILKTAENIIISNGYNLITGGYQKCSEVNIASIDYACGASGYKNGIELYISFNGSSSIGEKGNFAGIVLNKHE